MKKIFVGFLIMILAFNNSYSQLSIKKNGKSLSIGNKNVKVKKRGEKITTNLNLKVPKLNKNKDMAKSGDRIDLPKTHPAYNDCKNLNRYVEKMELYFKGDTPESFFNKSFIAKSKTYLQACKDKTQGQNYDWASYETRISFIEKKHNLFSAKSATASTVINRTKTNSNSFNSKSNAVDNRARKSELKAELKVLKPSLELIFDAKRFQEKDFMMLNGSGFEYEKAANKLNLAEVKQKFADYKEISNGVAFGISKIKSIDFLIANYDDFVRDLIVAKARKLLDDSYNENAFAASELKSLNLSKEALAYLNGASKFSSISEIASLKKEAQSRISELGGGMSKELTGTFHTANVGKIFFSKKYIPYEKLGNVSAADFTTSFAAGDAVWAYFFAPGSVGKIGNKDRIKSSILNANKYKNGLMPTTFEAYIGGKQVVLFYSIPNISPAQDLNKSVFIVPLIPNEVFFKTQFFKSIKNGGHHYAEVYKKMKMLPPRGIKIKIVFEELTYWSKLKAEDEITVTVDRDYYAKMYNLCTNIGLDDVRMAKPKGSNSAIEARIKTSASKYGTVLRVVQFTSTTVHKNKLTGIPEDSYQRYQVAYKANDGQCYIIVYEHKKNYVGNKWVDAGVHNQTYDVTQSAIRCQNVTK